MTARSRRVRLGVGLALLTLAGCGESSTGLSLTSIVLSTAPTGYSAQPVAGGDGTVSIDDASSATPADPAAVHAFLQSSSWRGTVVRVWVQGQDYAEDIGFAFASASDATRFAKFEVDALRASPTNYVYAVPQIPAGQAFILYSQTRVGGKDVFCNGAWFSYQTDAFELLTCGAVPQDGQLANSLAIMQLQRAGGAPASVAPT